MKLPRVFRRRERAVSSGSSPIPPDTAAAVQSGQQSIPTLSLFGSLLSKVQGSIPKRQAIYDVDVNELKRYPVETLLANLDSISPEASMALWTMRRLCGSPRIAGVVDQDGTPNQKAYDYLLAVEPLIAPHFGGFPGLAGQVHSSLYVQGGIGLEVVLAENKRDTLDIVSVDPSSLNWYQERLDNGQIGYIPKQMQGTGLVELTKPGFFYAPLDPRIGDPQGTSPILSLFQVIFADLQTYYDLEKVIHNQGFPRYHAKLVGELIRKNAPASIANDESKLTAYTKSQLALVGNMYKALEPDDAWVTLDSVDIKSIETGTSSAVTAATLQQVYKTKIANALKMLSIYLNYTAGSTETYGTVQWKIMVDTIESLRAIAKKALEDALTFAVNVKGFSGWAVIEYEALPRETALVDEQVKMAKVKRYTFMRDAGYILHDTAAGELLDMDAAEAEAVPMFGLSSGGALAEDSEEKSRTVQKEKSEQTKYCCECLDCGKQIESTEHCRSIKCPSCGGEMRRVERPGPGSSLSAQGFAEERGHTTVHANGRRSLSIPKAITLERSYRQLAAGKYRRQTAGLKRLLKDSLKLS